MTPESGAYHSCFPECPPCKIDRLQEANKYMQRAINGFPDALRAAQAEQRTKDAEIARGRWKELSKHFHSPHTVCREIADAIEAQEE